MKRVLIVISLGLLYYLPADAQWWTYLDFDSPPPDSVFQIDTAVGNIWQIGSPSKIFFDSAYSAPNAIVTDTLNYYPVNNTSSFTVMYSSFLASAPCIFIILDFWHKLDADSLQDGGYIEVSYDLGATWINIADPPINCYYEYPLNPIIANGSPAFTGRTQSYNNWEYVYLSWTAWSLPHDSLYARFVFYSDSVQSSREGWMIDNLYFWATVCEDIDEIGGLNNDGIRTFPNPTSNKITLNLPSHLQQPENIQVYDRLGRLLMDCNYSPELDVSSLAGGLYYVVVSNGNGERLSGRFLKE